MKKLFLAVILAVACAIPSNAIPVQKAYSSIISIEVTTSCGLKFWISADSEKVTMGEILDCVQNLDGAYCAIKILAL